MQDTIIKVGVTRQDDYGNLWVTPTDGGQEVKIGEKRSALFPLFQQGNTVSLHWETFKNKPYIKDAKQIAGEPAQPAKIPTQPRQEAFKADPEKIASMERQKAMEIDSKFRDTALMQACAVAKERTTEGILHCADLFYAWLEGEKAPEKTEHKESLPPAQQEASLPIVDGQTGRPEGMPATLTDGTKMFSYVNKRGVSLAEWTATVQSPPNEVKTEAQLIAAWNVLAPKMKVK